MPIPRALLRLTAAAALALAAACADSTSTSAPPPAPVPEPPAAVRLECRADVVARMVRCTEPGAAGGVRADRILGQGTGVKLTSGNVAIVADSFTFDLTVTNQFEYPIGTTDGVNPDPNGIRVFIVDGIHTTAGSGAVTVANADGVGTFTATNQPYFAYVGVLEPGATTPARRWKLRFDPGVQTFSFGLYVSTPVPPGGGTVRLTILQPLPDSIFQDSVVVRVRIDSSPASIQSVKAFVADRSVVLAPYAAGAVRGTLPLTGLGFGPHPIRVHAVTVRADTGNAYVTIRRDEPPTLTVAQPMVDAVARPNLRIDADCVDDDPAGCASVVVSTGGVQLASGTTGVHADVSLAAYVGKHPTIQVDALDSGGHKRTTTVTVYVESAAALIFADSAGSRAMALDSTRLLFADAANGVWLRDRATGTRTFVEGAVGTPSGHLFPLGAIFVRSITGRIYEWRNGAPYDLKAVTSLLTVEGNWAAWPTSGTVTRRDLAAGTNVIARQGASQSDVAANGDVVFTIGSGGTAYVARYRDGTVTPITPVGAYSAPVTDGTHVVYLKGAQVAMWNGATETVLSNALTGAVAHTHYEAAGGWVAWAVVDGGGATQLRVRAPDGTVRQVTSYGTSSLIRALGPDGTLVYANGGSLYALRAPFTGARTRLGTDWFRVRFRGTELQLFLGNTAFHASY